ncbi:MAG: hypothetical protein GEU94_00735 [Micromonosporaceae bacterium]|nr:hypothetical protein [Micromonosporaceae bacterium]
MTAAHAHDDLHQLVDQLTPRQADAVRAVVLQLVKNPSEQDSDRPPGRRRTLSFAGIMDAEPDLAERSEEMSGR